MPLRAIIENKEVISTFLSKEEWINLKDYIKSNNVDVLISQTLRKGYLRTSKLGLQHFAHKNGEKSENWKPESQQHLLAKSEVLLGCKDAGWQAKSEFSEDDWITDVIAIKGKIRVAFEIQWSRQSYERTIEKQNMLKESSVRGCWFFKSPPKEIRDWDKKVIAKKEIPLFRIFENDNKEINVGINDNTLPLKTFVTSLLTGKIKYCSKLKTNKMQTIKISFWKTNCWKCGAEQYVYFVADELKSKCGCSIDLINTFWDDSKFEFYPPILNAVSEIVNSEKGKNIRIGKIKKRYSYTVKKSYISFGCYKCDSIFGDFPLMEERIEILSNEGDVNDIVFEKEIELKTPLTENKAHWCFSESKEFCE